MREENLDKYDHLVRYFCGGFPDQLDFAESLLSSLGEVDISNREHAFYAMYNEIHRLAGAAHCMGFRFVGKALSEVVDRLDNLLSLSEPEMQIELLLCRHKVHAIAGLAERIRPENSYLFRQERESALEQVIFSEEEMEVIANQRVLFADDDTFTRLLLQDYLQKIGVGAVQLAISGKEALSAFKSFSPTIVIADWNMPPLDGMGLLQLVRSGQTKVDTDVSFIFLSTHNSFPKIKDAMRLNIDQFIMKPFTMEVVANAIRKSIQKQDINAAARAG